MESKGLAVRAIPLLMLVIFILFWSTTSVIVARPLFLAPSVVLAIFMVVAHLRGRSSGGGA